jgi:hypothetical protein
MFPPRWSMLPRKAEAAGPGLNMSAEQVQGLKAVLHLGKLNISMDEKQAAHGLASVLQVGVLQGLG